MFKIATAVYYLCCVCVFLVCSVLPLYFPSEQKMQRSPLQNLTLQNGLILGLNIKPNALVNLDSSMPTFAPATAGSSQCEGDGCNSSSKSGSGVAPKTPLKPSGQIAKAGQACFSGHLQNMFVAYHILLSCDIIVVSAWPFIWCGYNHGHRHLIRRG